MLVIANLLWMFCLYETLSIPILMCLLNQLWTHLSLQCNYRYSVTQSCCWLLPLNKSHEITQQSIDCTKKWVGSCVSNKKQLESLSDSCITLIPDYMYYTNTKFMHMPSPLCSALEMQFSKEPIKELPVWWTDSAVLNYAILVLPLFMPFTLQANSTPKWW